MNRVESHAGWVILASFIAAFLLTAMPLPPWALAWRPIWVAMVLMYWCMALPGRIGIGVGWLVGLFLDVQQGTVLGQHALGLALIAYITLRYHQRVRVLSLTQQALVVCGVLLLFEFITLWIRGMMGIPPRHWTFWMPALTSMLLWPWLFIILRDLRRRYHVT
ncbi:MAG: rod shape-determining protein MreD [Gammaproteobacteria bacterium]|nr:rod shape-determining protein MreD [Gammaproteobacteria bacterium]